MGAQGQLVFPSPERLLEALEAGEWRKGVGALRPEADRYCALGVGCRLVGAEIPVGDDAVIPRDVGVGRGWLRSAPPGWLNLKIQERCGHEPDSWLTALADLNDEWRGWAPIVAALRRFIREGGP